METSSVKAHLVSPSIFVSCLNLQKVVRLLTNGNVVVIVDADQVAQLEMSGEGSSLACDTLHGTTVTKDTVGVVVDKIISWLVEHGGSVGLSNRQTNCVGETLTQWAGCHLDTGGVVSLGMARGDAVDLLQPSQLPATFESDRTYSEVFEVIHGDAVAEQVQEGILQHAAMSVAVGS